jgi:arylsulfatase A-like enzyme
VKVLKERPRDKPFFMWFAALDPHRDYFPNIIARPHAPADAIVPPYLPDTAQVRADLAMYYDEIARLDGFVGRVLDELDAQKVADDTLVVFMSDNGRPFPRCKTTLYESGIRTPLIMRWPARIAADKQCNALVSSVDLGMTFLELAGVKPHANMQGPSFAGVLCDPGAAHREFAFAEHNWHDYDAFERGVRSPRFKYIRNLDATLPLTPPADAVRSPTFVEMRRLRDAGQLPKEQSQCFVHPRAEEEFYDLQTDPHELQNLANEASLASNAMLATELARHRSALDAWRRDTGDLENVRAPDEFDRESGAPLKSLKRPRASKSSLK